MNPSRISRRRAVPAGLVGGAVAAAIFGGIDAAQSRGSGVVATSLAAVLRIVAAAPPPGLAPPTSHAGLAAVGVAAHLLVSLCWGVGYALLAARTPALIEAPLISGLAYGVVVELMMDGLLVAVGAFVFPTPARFALDLIGHTIGFGVPLAFVVAHFLRSAPAPRRAA